MKALVTGGRGFIGSFLVEQLLSEGHEVRCLLRPKGGDLGWLTGLNVEIISGDVNDPVSVERAVADADYIFHLAGLTKSYDPKVLYTVNVGGTERLLDAAGRLAGGLERFVLVSSLAAAGPSRDGRPVTETDPPRPVSEYGRSKLEAERIARGYADRLPVTVVRPPAVYGPRDGDFLEYFRFCRKGWLPLLSGGPRYTSVVFVKDLVAGMRLAVQEEQAVGQTYFMAADPVYTWEYLGRNIAAVLGMKTRKVILPLALARAVCVLSEGFARLFKKNTLFNLDKFRELTETHWICDSNKAKEELGFHCAFSLEAGLEQTAAWYLAHGWI